MSGIPLPEASLPALEPLINGDLWHTWAERGQVFALDDLRGAVRYVRLKPGVSCRLTVFGEAAHDLPLGFLLQLFPDLERARAAFQKERAREHVTGGSGYEPFLCETTCTLAVPYPNDPDLPVLRHVHDPGQLRRTLAAALDEFPREHWRVRKRRIRTELLAYKPGRRAVYRVEARLRNDATAEDRTVVLNAKFSDAETIGRSRARLAALHVAEGGPRLPRPLGATDRMFACEWIEGRSLQSIVDEGGSAAVDALTQTGEAVARLHALDAALDDWPSPANENARLRTIAADVARLLPGSKTRLTDLGQRLGALVERLATECPVPVHGDLHLGQAIADEHGVSLVDLDRARRGHPAQDLGRLLAHLLERRAPASLDVAFLEGYAGVTRLPTEASLQVSTASHLFRRAAFSLRSLDPDWPEETRRRLDLVEDLLR